MPPAETLQAWLLQALLLSGECQLTIRCREADKKRLLGQTGVSRSAMAGIAVKLIKHVSAITCTAFALFRALIRSKSKVIRKSLLSI